MTDLRFIGDIHFGKRMSYTTLNTAARFDRLRANLLDKVANGTLDYIQLGDLFDDFSVNSETLVDGYLFAKRMKATLVGNHDLSKNIDKASSLHLLRSPLGVDVAHQPTKFTQGMTTFILCPHQLTQEKFEQALIQDVGPMIGPKTDYKRFVVLCLHCNYGEHRGAEGDNYLTPAIAKGLLDAGVNLIVSGHEHNYREPIGGVIMLGSILPFSFGEMETKYVLDYNTQSGEHKLVPIWEDKNFIKVNAKDYVEGSTWNTNYQFIEVTGEVDVETAAKINRTTAGIYRNSDVIMAIKNSTILHRHTKTAVADRREHWLDLLLAECVTDEQKEALKILAGEFDET